MFEDYKKYITKPLLSRVTGSVFMLLATTYLTWLFLHLNWQYPIFVLLFFITQCFIFLSASISVVNHWKQNYRILRPQITEAPPVAIVIPTYKEPINIIKETLNSALRVNYKGELVIILTNDDTKPSQVYDLQELVESLDKKNVHLIHSIPHSEAKAGNLNQALTFIRQNYPHIDLILTQDADEIMHADILNATVGYFTNNANIAYVQTIKQSKTHKNDPFGNRDIMWYGRTAPARDADNAMFACGSGVIWRISALESVGGFSTWNLVEDLTTSYELLSKGWESAYHYEALSIGLAPEDMANYLKQRGTWALDTMRLFFFKNPLFNKGLTIKQKLHFLELPFFYLNGSFILLLVFLTVISLTFNTWPTTANATEHASFLLPSFFALEAYYISLASKIPQRRVRQYWVGLAPVFTMAVIKALVYGPNNKPTYKVTKKENTYSNYLNLVLPQIIILSIIAFAVLRIITQTPLYSNFDWAVFFWGIYQASFYIQIIKVSWWGWKPSFNINLNPLTRFGTQRRVSMSYNPDNL